jgi:hypothetical protein
MTTPNVVPTGYAGDDTDYLIVRRGENGSIYPEFGAVTVPSTTAADAYVGLRPFQKGATFHAPSFHCGNFGAGTTTVNFGIIYDDNVTYTNDVDLFVSLSTAAQSGGYVTLDEKEWLNYVTTGNGWVVAQLKTAGADAEESITFNFGVSYGTTS